MIMSIFTTNITYLHRTAKNSSNQNIQKIKQVIGIQDSQNSWKIYEEISSYFATTYHMLLYWSNKYLTATAGKKKNKIMLLQLYFISYKIMYRGR